MKRTPQRTFVVTALLAVAIACAILLGGLYPCGRTAYRAAALLAVMLAAGGAGVGTIFRRGALGAVAGLASGGFLAPVLVVVFEAADC